MTKRTASGIRCTHSANASSVAQSAPQWLAILLNRVLSRADIRLALDRTRSGCANRASARPAKGPPPWLLTRSGKWETTMSRTANVAPQPAQGVAAMAGPLPVDVRRSR